MADLGGFSAERLRFLIRREVRHMNSDYSLEQLPETVLSPNQKLRQNALLLLCVSQFLSAVTLCLVAVDTLTYADPLLVFVPTFFSALFLSIGGAFYVTISWLNANLITNAQLIKSGVILNITAQLCCGLLIGWLFFWFYESIPVAETFLDEHQLALGIILPISGLLTTLTSWSTTGFLIHKLRKHMS